MRAFGINLACYSICSFGAFCVCRLRTVCLDLSVSDDVFCCNFHLLGFSQDTAISAFALCISHLSLAYELRKFRSNMERDWAVSARLGFFIMRFNTPKSYLRSDE